MLLEHEFEHSRHYMRPTHDSWFCSCYCEYCSENEKTQCCDTAAMVVTARTTAVTAAAAAACTTTTTATTIVLATLGIN